MRHIKWIMGLVLWGASGVHAYWVEEPEGAGSRYVWHTDVGRLALLADAEDGDTVMAESDEEGAGSLPQTRNPSALRVEITPRLGIFPPQIHIEGMTRPNVSCLQELPLPLPEPYALTVKGDFWSLETPLVEGATWLTLEMVGSAPLDVSGAPTSHVMLKNLTLRGFDREKDELRRTLLELALVRGEILTTQFVVTPVWTARQYFYGRDKQEFFLFNTREILYEGWEDADALRAWRRAQRPLDNLLEKQSGTTRENLSAVLAPLRVAKTTLEERLKALRARSFGFQADVEIQAAGDAVAAWPLSQEGMPGMATALREVVLPHTRLTYHGQRSGDM